MRKRIWIGWALVAAGCLDQAPGQGGESDFEFTASDGGVAAQPAVSAPRKAGGRRRPAAPTRTTQNDADAGPAASQSDDRAGEAGAAAARSGPSAGSGASAPMPTAGRGGSAPAGGVAYGALVITEWMADPAARSDGEGEWIELYNASSAPVDLAGCAVGDGGAASHALSEHVVLAPGEYATLASSPDPGFRPSIAISLALKNSADVIELHCGGVLIDRVAYDEAQDFPVVAGAATALDPRSLDADANDAPSAWCSATPVYAQDRGTPGTANPSCAGQSSQAGSSGASQPASTPKKSKAPDSKPSASAPRLPAGAVVITELMTDPRARSDSDGEWIELYNTTAQAIDLAGCAIADGSASPHSISEPLRIESKAYATIANGMDPGFRPSFAGALSLNNSADVVELRCGDAVVDRVAYDEAQGFPLEAGASMALAPDRLGAQSNDSAAAWCLASDEYGTDRGTPGRQNPPCRPPALDGGAPAADSAPTWPESDSAAAAEPTAPSLAPGAVVITEIMADPDALSDARGEWVELYNGTAEPIDLAGCAIGDGTTEPRALTEPMRIDPGGYATLAATADPGFKATAVATLSLRNDADVIELRCGEVVIDRVAFDRSQGFPIAAGASASLDPSKLSASDNDAPSAWCASTQAYAIDRGTPGAPNPPCALQPADPAGNDPSPDSTSDPQTNTDPDPPSASDSGSPPEKPAEDPHPDAGSPAQAPDSGSPPQEAAPESASDAGSPPEEAAPETGSNEPETESGAEPAEPQATEPESEPAETEPPPVPDSESEPQPADPEPPPAVDPEPPPVEPDPEPSQP